jgi:5-methylcytosine-specific restriction endonuclease McrA
MTKKPFVDYTKHINSERWERRRLRAIDEVGGACQMCGSTDRIQVHHLNYDNLGNEKPEDLLVVCRQCHRKVHQGEI